jgi:hypothetical protein
MGFVGTRRPNFGINMSVAETGQAASVNPGEAAGNRHRRNSQLRSVFITFCCIASSLLGVRLLQIDGCIRTVEVIGPSMAPTVWGPSTVLTCQQCGLSVRAVWQQEVTKVDWICSNCGRPQADDAVLPIPGDRVWIDRGAYWFQPPQRDDLVAIRTADDSLRVKRVAGLPGETIGIQQGDLWVNGQRWRKSLTQARGRFTLVYDDRHRSLTGGLRWQPTSDAGISVVKEGGYEYAAAGQFHFLRYHHFSPYGGETSWHASPVLSDSPTNPRISQVLYRTEDLCLSGAIYCQEAADLIIAIYVTGGCASVKFSLEKDKVARWQFAWLDGQPWLLLDGCVSAEPLCEPTPDELPAALIDAEHPLLLGCRSQGECRLTDLVVCQDLFLLGPVGQERSWQNRPLAQDHYFLLGDNVALSADDRLSPEGTARGKIIGRVIPRPSAIVIP